ncbi:head maturation protease, ClpP-related [Notoacmeibacter sp. MSK16QG-6]|uniref:head maturation protease, ClpP-related n=1 Tax=Notoacmeibacter sp. MSK16QG-6 TaxID=2957982 RepID=UPI00209F75D5|nr:head maturation protease, ClpP-related [Notoacmeibacter sp. MSK16QG-6]MCP1200062.1 Clp protease ClpP [Notoacmeibacter sp. MSK16QG-6]
MMHHRPPRAITGPVFARSRPSALPMPANREVLAFTKEEVMNRWSADLSGVRALSQGDNVITMFDVIGEDWWTGGGVTAKKVASQLRAIGDRPVEVQINSPGGDMFEGIAIYNVLREHSQEVTVKIMGMAASAASVIAMAGDRIEIGAASFVMIHNCWVLAIGNRHDMAEVAEWLEPFDQAMADLYAQRTEQDVAQIGKWMDAETYMSGTLAVDRGFADELLSADRMVEDEEAKARAFANNDVRSTELSLVRAGLSRSEARARINRIKGTPGAAPEATPGAGDTDWSALSAGLLQTIRT